MFHSMHTELRSNGNLRVRNVRSRSKLANHIKPSDVKASLASSNLHHIGDSISKIRTHVKARGNYNRELVSYIPEEQVLQNLHQNILGCYTSYRCVVYSVLRVSHVTCWSIVKCNCISYHPLCLLHEDFSN